MRANIIYVVRCLNLINNILVVLLLALDPMSMNRGSFVDLIMAIFLLFDYDYPFLLNLTFDMVDNYNLNVDRIFHRNMDMLIPVKEISFSFIIQYYKIGHFITFTLKFCPNIYTTLIISTYKNQRFPTTNV